MFVAFEGGEGTGKSTQARLLAARLGPSCVLTREPGGTDLGAAIRTLVLGGSHDVDDRAEALLMAADRAHHVASVIRPALASGRHVVTDRYAGSSLAYQGIGRRLGVEAVRALSSFATGDLWPDAVVLLTVPPAVRDARLAARGGLVDRLEAAGAEFHTAVEAGFLALAAAEPERWVVVDGAASEADVAESVWKVLTPFR